MARDWRDAYDTVRFWQRAQDGTDQMGEPTYAWTYTDVAGVAVRTGAAQDVQGTGSAADVRPDGVRVRYTLALPKGHGLDLRRARVTFPDRGQTATTWEDAEAYALAVTGDPAPQEPCPTQWDTIVEVGRVDG